MTSPITSLVSFLSDHFIRGIFISILTIALAGWFNKGINMRISITIIRWTIILYAILATADTIASFAFGFSDSYQERMSGPYWTAYWFMIFANTLLPLLLLLNKIRDKLLWLFVISIAMNAGWLFESYVIHVTSLHRDHMPEGSISLLPYTREWIIISKGFALGVVALAIEIFWFRQRV
jgi:hypothetical protein